MEFVGWFLSGVCRVLGWFLSGVCRVLGWFLSGVCRVLGWFLSGVCRVLGWFLSGVCRVLGWFLSGLWYFHSPWTGGILWQQIPHAFVAPYSTTVAFATRGFRIDQLVGVLDTQRPKPTEKKI